MQIYNCDSDSVYIQAAYTRRINVRVIAIATIESFLVVTHLYRCPYDCEWICQSSPTLRKLLRPISVTLTPLYNRRNQGRSLLLTTSTFEEAEQDYLRFYEEQMRLLLHPEKVSDWMEIWWTQAVTGGYSITEGYRKSVHGRVHNLNSRKTNGGPTENLF